MDVSDLNTKIDVKPYGTLELFEFVLNDMRWLDNANTKELPARTFSVDLIHSHLVSPNLDAQTISGWSDELLVFVVTQWLKSQQQPEDTSEIGGSFEELKQTVYEYHEELVGPSRRIFGAMLETSDWVNKNLKSGIVSMMPLINSIGTSPLSSVGTLGSISNIINVGTLATISDSVATFPKFTNGIGVLASQLSPTSQIGSGLGLQFSELTANFASITEKVSVSTQSFTNAMLGITHLAKLDFVLPKTLTEQLFTGLPDFTDWERFIEESRETHEAFYQAGYSFTNHLVSYSSIRRFASINPKVRNAVITKSLASETRSHKFEEHLHQLFEQSSVLRRRWKIVKKALRAHRRREYDMSILPLLAQVEGIIGDAMILRKLITPVGHKLFLIGSDGKPLEENGKMKQPINGLDKLIQHSKWRDDASLQGVAELFTSYLARERNGIMHGRNIKYGTAKLSTQGLLLLLVLATMFVELEK